MARKSNTGIPGLSFSWKRALGITQAKQLLLNTDDRISDICLSVGFSDNVTFNRAFRRVVGVSPTDYRNQFSFAEHDGDAD